MDEAEGDNGTDGSVSDVSQADISVQSVEYHRMTTPHLPGHKRAALNNAFAQSTESGRQLPDRPGCARGTYCRIYASLCNRKRVSSPMYV